MGQPTCSNELRVCGKLNDLGVISVDFLASYNEGKLSLNASYMDAGGQFATKWKKSGSPGEHSQKAAVYHPVIQGPQPRTGRLRMQEVACAACGIAGTGLKKCGRCLRTFYCCKEHQENVRRFAVSASHLNSKAF